jgi:hypothetical protein
VQPGEPAEDRRSAFACTLQRNLILDEQARFAAGVLKYVQTI